MLFGQMYLTLAIFFQIIVSFLLRVWVVVIGLDASFPDEYVVMVSLADVSGLSPSVRSM